MQILMLILGFLPICKLKLRGMPTTAPGLKAFRFSPARKYARPRTLADRTSTSYTIQTVLLQCIKRMRRRCRFR